jgi:FkbH-like protein
LSGLGTEARVFDIRLEDNARASRAIELLNKTNQFNTTGRRWTAEDFRALSDKGGSMVGFKVRDKFTDYGMVGVIVLSRGAVEMRIEQVVMSCRVFGFDVELAVLFEVVKRAEHSGEHRLTGIIQKLSANQPCWDLFERLGFVEASDGLWSVSDEYYPTKPFNVSVQWEELPASSE